jgi:branched-chain amino acid transport system substrate-binding protein
VVGTLNSPTAQTAVPILADRGIATISPANTSPVLTLGADATSAPSRPYPTYFRLAATDLVQGPFAARYLVQKAGKKRFAVVDDGTSYGVLLAEQFAQEAGALGATIAVRTRHGVNDADYSPLIAQIRPAAADAVYYGGTFQNAGPVSRQMAAAGLVIPLMGSDGILYRDYVRLGGRTGDLATLCGAPAESLPGAARFVTDYRAAHYADASGDFGVSAYDAANVVIAAVASAVRNATWSPDTRAAVVRNVQATNVQGASGPIAFDRYGDTTNKQLTVYTVSGDHFVPVVGSTAAFGT